MKKKKSHFLRVGHERSDAFLVSIGVLFLVGAFTYLMSDPLILRALQAAIAAQ